MKMFEIEAFENENGDISLIQPTADDPTGKKVIVISKQQGEIVCGWIKSICEADDDGSI